MPTSLAWKIASNKRRRLRVLFFSNTVLPLVKFCDEQSGRNDAGIINDNMKLGSPKPNFVAVKQAFEANYECLGITCADVGGLWGGNSYLEGADPCSPSSEGSLTCPGATTDTGIIAAIGVIGAVALIALLLTLVLIMREKAGKPIFLHVPNGGGDVKSAPGRSIA